MTLLNQKKDQNGDSCLILNGAKIVISAAWEYRWAEFENAVIQRAIRVRVLLFVPQ